MRCTLTAVCLALVAAAAAHAQRLVIDLQTDSPPGALGDPIEALMAAGGPRVHMGQTTLDFWWVKTVPLTTESRGVSWSALAEGTLIGAVMLSAPYPDARGQMVPAGIYTLRCIVQPQAADGAGVAPPGHVLILAPVADDDKPDALGHDDAVALAKQTAGALNPPQWRINPSAGAADSPRPGDEGQTAIAVAIPASRDGMDVGTLAFDVVLVGAIRPR